jgi:hypothetical protein
MAAGLKRENPARTTTQVAGILRPARGGRRTCGRCNGIRTSAVRRTARQPSGVANRMVRSARPTSAS